MSSHVRNCIQMHIFSSMYEYVVCIRLVQYLWFVWQTMLPFTQYDKHIRLILFNFNSYSYFSFRLPANSKFNKIALDLCINSCLSLKLLYKRFWDVGLNDATLQTTLAKAYSHLSESGLDTKKSHTIWPRNCFIMSIFVVIESSH